MVPIVLAAMIWRPVKIRDNKSGRGLLFFFFQAEDGIRYKLVTGVQTCALPIFRILCSPPQAPRANAICERLIRELRRELFDRVLIINEEHLRRTLTTYLAHRNEARPDRKSVV